MRRTNLQYITNPAGEKTAVILPIDEFEELLEDLQDLAAVAERREEPTVPHDELLADLKLRSMCLWSSQLSKVYGH